MKTIKYKLLIDFPAYNNKSIFKRGTILKPYENTNCYSPNGKISNDKYIYEDILKMKGIAVPVKHEKGEYNATVKGTNLYSDSEYQDSDSRDYIVELKVSSDVYTMLEKNDKVKIKF